MNEPLTLEELQQMDGEPVWIEYRGAIRVFRGWAIVGRYYDGSVALHTPDNVYYEAGIRSGDVIVYALKPEEKEGEKQ